MLAHLLNHTNPRTLNTDINQVIPFQWVSLYLFGWPPVSHEKFKFSRKENLKFFRQNVCSKFRNTGKLIPFGFEGSKFVDMKAQKGQLTFS